MLGWEVVKSKQDFFIFLEAFAGFWELDLVTGVEPIKGCQSGFAGGRQVHFMDQLLRLSEALERLVARPQTQNPD